MKEDDDDDDDDDDDERDGRERIEQEAKEETKRGGRWDFRRVIKTMCLDGSFEGLLLEFPVKKWENDDGTIGNVGNVFVVSFVDDDNNDDDDNDEEDDDDNDDDDDDEDDDDDDEDDDDDNDDEEHGTPFEKENARRHSANKRFRESSRQSTLLKSPLVVRGDLAARCQFSNEC
uniref:Uncharacterized protein n=1 Tax=Vespula pensylvanica TaxID=30213 RepID=A0A834UA11_VESPE|nr:hypothetical protein H0235_007897 [Vespula pensylvanica]